MAREVEKKEQLGDLQAYYKFMASKYGSCIYLHNPDDSIKMEIIFNFKL